MAAVSILSRVQLQQGVWAMHAAQAKNTQAQVHTHMQHKVYKGLEIKWSFLPLHCPPLIHSKVSEYTLWNSKSPYAKTSELLQDSNLCTF